MDSKLNWVEEMWNWNISSNTFANSGHPLWPAIKMSNFIHQRMTIWCEENISWIIVYAILLYFTYKLSRYKSVWGMRKDCTCVYLYTQTDEENLSDLFFFFLFYWIIKSGLDKNPISFHYKEADKITLLFSI